MKQEQRRTECATKAEQTAGLLVGDLRELHSSFCVDESTVAENIASNHLLALIARAADLRNELKSFLT